MSRFQSVHTGALPLLLRPGMHSTCPQQHPSHSAHQTRALGVAVGFAPTGARGGGGAAGSCPNHAPPSPTPVSVSCLGPHTLDTPTGVLFRQVHEVVAELLDLAQLRLAKGAVGAADEAQVGVFHAVTALLGALEQVDAEPGACVCVRVCACVCV